MTVEERKELLRTWVNLIIENDYDFHLVFQVCSTRLFESVELAAYAQELYNETGLPNAIASLPPYYERPSTSSDQFNQMMSWFRPVVDAAPDLPFWYYHLPEENGVTLNMYEFVYYAWNGNDQGTSLPELKGTKYVMKE